MDKPKLNKVNIRKWVKALRSGKYRQGRGSLKWDGRYCCLGVACVVAGVAIMENDISFGEHPEMYQWLGLEHRWDGDIELTDNLSATIANDDNGWSFKRIATALEKRYLTPAKKAKKRAVR